METLLIVLAFMLGWNLHSVWMARRIMKIMDRIQEQEDIADESMFAVKLEKQGDTVLVYNKETNAFIVQVKSKQEFIDHCHTHYQGKIVFMTKSDIEVLDSL
jgi:hypothetical protein